MAKGYGGHDASKPIRIFRSGQKRGVHSQIRKELRRRSAIEPLIGLCKEGEYLDLNGNQINAVMSVVGYNFRLILK